MKPTVGRAIRIGLPAIAALAACAPLSAPSALSSAGRCESIAERTIAFTSETAQDVFEVNASGADCATAIVTVSIRQQNGQPVMAFAVPLAWLSQQTVQEPIVSPEALARFVADYAAAAQLDIGASQLPAWINTAPTPGFDQGQELTSPLDRKTYEALRKTKPNMLCMGDAHETGICYVWDRKRATAEIILRR
ncbi:MAG: hypothetical protein K8S25_09100 [Alphaproteobacteria bacterium]|nr:hypothetical protein [Alphaproteobacteria bacterium]